MNTFLVTVGKGVVIGAVLLGFFVVGLIAFGLWHDEWSGYNAQFRASDGMCNIAIIPLAGDLSSYMYTDPVTGESYPYTALDDFEFLLRNAELDPTIEGIIISVDSPGGSPYYGEAIANDLMRSSLPTVAVIRDQGLSAAYWASSGADHIIASAVSDVGSIGVTMSYLERVRQNEADGLDYIEISSGPYKDAGSPDRFLSDEEAAQFQRSVDIVHDEFVRAVARNRDMPQETVAMLADGSSMTGAEALEAGLIDALGDKESARAWFAQHLAIDAEYVTLCE